MFWLSDYTRKNSLELIIDLDIPQGKIDRSTGV